MKGHWSRADRTVAVGEEMARAGGLVTARVIAESMFAASGLGWTEADQETACDTKRRAALVWAALAFLPPRYRRVLTLRFGIGSGRRSGGMELLKNIGRLEGIDVQSALRMEQRGLSMLRRRLRKMRVESEISPWSY